MTIMPAPAGDPPNPAPVADPPAPTLEALQAQLAESNKALKAANRESAERRKRLDDLEAAEADRKKAALSEVERLQADVKDAQAKAEKANADALASAARATDALLRAEVSAVALAQGVDEAELRTLWLLMRDDAGLRDRIKPKADTDGEFEGVKEVVAEMVKAHPRWLKAGPVAQPNINAANRGTAGGDVNLEELMRRKRASGEYSL